MKTQSMTTIAPDTYKKSLSPVVQEAVSIKIENSKDMERATFLLSKLNALGDAITAEKEKVLNPLNEARTAEIKRWKPALTELEAGIEPLREKISVYQTTEMKRVKEEEDRIASRVKEGKGNLSVDTAVKRMQEIEKPDARIETNAGTLKFRAVDTLKIVDPLAIPREYLIPDEKKIFLDLKSGLKVEGCVIEVKQVPVNSR